MNPLERHRRRVRDYGPDEEQVANAHDDFPNLTPASTEPAARTLSNWLALTSGQAVPLVGERVYPDELED